MVSLLQKYPFAGIPEADMKKIIKNIAAICCASVIAAAAMPVSAEDYYYDEETGYYYDDYGNWYELVDEPVSGYIPQPDDVSFYVGSTGSASIRIDSIDQLCFSMNGSDNIEIDGVSYDYMDGIITIDFSATEAGTAVFKLYYEYDPSSVVYFNVTAKSKPKTDSGKKQNNSNSGKKQNSSSGNGKKQNNSDSGKKQNSSSGNGKKQNTSNSGKKQDPSSGSGKKTNSGKSDKTVKKSAAEQVFDIVNEERVNAGKSKLTLDSTLCKAAQVRAKEIGKKFSHTRPNGTSCSTILDEYNVSYWACGENIAQGHQSAKSVMKSWMRSAGHRSNILSSSYTKIGIGYDPSTNSWVQIFIG